MLFSGKILNSMRCPKILNCNPRSVYNKNQNLKTFILEEEIDVAVISESWERPDQTLDTVLDIDDYIVISNPFQRPGIGGRPALIINSSKFIDFCFK